MKRPLVASVQLDGHVASELADQQWPVSLGAADPGHSGQQLSLRLSRQNAVQTPRMSAQFALLVPVSDKTPRRPISFAGLPADTLTGHRDRFNAQFKL